MTKAINWCKSNPILTVILALCIGYGIFYLASAVKWIPYPNQIDYGEGLIMYINNMWATGTWKWDLNISPYIPLMYGVTMPLLFAPLIKVFGSDLWLGRTVMFISTLIICWLLYLIAKRITGKKVYGIIAGLLPLTHPVIRDWSLMARVDMLAVMLSFVGFYIVVRYKDSKWIYLSILFFTITLLTKISVVSGIGATLIYLLIYNRKTFYKYFPLTLLAIISSFALMGIITKGAYFDHILLYNATVNTFWNLATIITNVSIVILPMIVVSAIALIFTAKILRKKYRTGLNVLIALFFVIAMVTNFASALRPGGFINYYLEFIFGACLCVSIILPSIIGKVEMEYRTKGKVLANGFLVMLLIVNFSTICYKHAFPFPNEKYTAEAKIVTEIIKNTDKPVVTENFGLVTNARKHIVCEHLLATNAAVLGTLDDTAYVNSFREQYYDFIILRVPTYKRTGGDWHFKKEIIDLIDKNYTLIYEPEENFYWYGLCVYKSNNTLTEGDIQDITAIERKGEGSLLDYTKGMPKKYFPGEKVGGSLWIQMANLISGVFK